MTLQDQLMGQLRDLIQFGKKIQNTDTVTETGVYALDATEKNPNIKGTMANQIKKLNSDLANLSPGGGGVGLTGNVTGINVANGNITITYDDGEDDTEQS